jgi:hypothetical protein
MKRVLTILLVVVLALSLGTVFTPAEQAVAADGVYNVPSPSYSTIQSAIDAAAAAGGGTVNVAPGVYREIIILKSGVKVLGAGWTVTSLDGGGTLAPLVIAGGGMGPADSTAMLSGFTITNGASNTPAIRILDASPTITNCFIAGNQCGGMRSRGGGSPTVTDCIFYANEALYCGGGMDNDGTATVTNCTFYANEAVHFGGGIHCGYRSSLNVTNCNFYANKAGREGGGMWCDGTTTVTNCDFFLNEASDRGGGLDSFRGTTTVSGCIFSTNKTSYEGGGIANENWSTATVTNCTFYANEAVNYGGGMYNRGTGAVTNCNFYGNEALYFGGGMDNEGTVTVTNCTFYANKSARRGGGMLNYHTATVTNCNFLGNEAGMEGGGLCNDNHGETATVTNCILWGDSAATGAEIYQASGASTVVTYCDVQGGYTGEGNIDAAPVFTDPGNLDFHLLPSSPCVDAGNDEAPALPDTDFEGDPRIMGATVDMGIDEAPGAANEPPVAEDDSATTDEDTPVTINVLANDSDPDEDDDLTVSEVTQGANGSVAINEDEMTVTYTPDTGFHGTDTFTYTASDGKGGTDTATVTVTVNPLVIEVTIDIKPGSDPNSINLGSKGVVPVAVLTTDDFDASEVDPEMVEFAGAEPERWTSEDVDGDGELDMLFHFKTEDLNLKEDSEDATLTGQTLGGHDITGTDSVRIVPPKGKK